MGLDGEPSVKGEFGDALHTDVDDLVDVLQHAFNEENFAVGNEVAIGPCDTALTEQGGPMSEERRDHTILSWTDYRGKSQERRVNLTLDVRDFLGTPGYSLLVVAANTNLSVSAIEDFLDVVARNTPAVSRSPNWIQKRRWLFQKPGTRNPKGSRANKDGMQERAVTIMGKHPELSLYKLRGLLRDHGICRSTEWICQHRTDATTSTVSP